MSHARAQFRQVLAQPSYTVAANIFDPLSARIAHMLNYDVCFLSGLVGKVANLGVPDIVLYNLGFQEQSAENVRFEDMSDWRIVLSPAKIEASSYCHH